MDQRDIERKSVRPTVFLGPPTSRLMLKKLKIAYQTMRAVSNHGIKNHSLALIMETIDELHAECIIFRAKPPNSIGADAFVSLYLHYMERCEQAVREHMTCLTTYFEELQSDDSTT